MRDLRKAESNSTLFFEQLNQNRRFTYLKVFVITQPII